MSVKNDPANQKAFFQEWLEKLQQESWQLELLISGFALYGVYGSKASISEFSNYIEISSIDGSVSFVAGMVVTMFKAGWALFFINLLAHIILRGLWIGAIGLRYVSREIDYDALNYSEWMTNYLRRKVGSYDDYIERLEKLCSVLFAYTFLLFFLVVSTIFFFASLALIGYLGQRFVSHNPAIGDSPVWQAAYGLGLMMYFLAGMVVFFDFITLGLIRRIKEPTFAKGYGYLYRFYSFITLSFLYRAILYNFLDDKYTRRLFLMGIPYVVLVLVVAPTIYTNGNAVFPAKALVDGRVACAVSGDFIVHKYYDDHRSKEAQAAPIKSISLDRYKYDDRLMEVFVRVDHDFDEVLREDADVDPIFKVGLQTTIGREIRKSAVVDSIRNLEDILLEPIVQEKSAKRARLKAEDKYTSEAKEALKKEYDLRYDSIDYVIHNMIIDHFEDCFSKIKSAIVDRVELTIDGELVKVEPEDVLFSEHHNLGEKGAIFYIALDSLDRGIHRLGYRRFEGDKDERLDYSADYTTTFEVPFIIK